MVWDVIRILIFTCGFLMGLLLSGAGGASTDSALHRVSNQRGLSETRCSGFRGSPVNADSCCCGTESSKCGSQNWFEIDSANAVPHFVSDLDISPSLGALMLSVPLKSSEPER